MATAEHLKSQMLERCFRKHQSLSDLEPVLSQAFKLSRVHFPNDISFSMPGMIRFETSFYTAINYHRFPSISVTGEKCQLNCEHCHGKILANMIPATNPERLLEVCTRIKEEGGEGSR